MTREECPEDGHGAFVVITPAGREAIEATAPLHVEAVRALFLDHVTPAELRTLARISERVVAHLDEDRRGGGRHKDRTPGLKYRAAGLKDRTRGRRKPARTVLLGGALPNATITPRRNPHHH